MDNRRLEGTIPRIVVEVVKAILHNMSRGVGYLSIVDVAGEASCHVDIETDGVYFI